MTRFKLLIVLVAAMIVAARCTPVDVPPPAVTPQGDDRYLLDPRTDSNAAMAPPIARKLESAWRFVLAGNEAEAQRLLNEIERTNFDLIPAQLTEAALHIRERRYSEANAIVAEVLTRAPDSIVARVYEAEIALREGRTRPAFDLYRAIAARPDAPPTANERVAHLQGSIFNELYASAQTAPPAEAVRLLREALMMNAGATEARVLLARNLLAQRQFDDARKELDPLLDTIADRPEIQEMLAEIEVGRGRFQEAIVRYDRLARRTKDERYARRLEEIKQEWSAANMPSHYRIAVDSIALTRAELATLLYWTVPSIRFAQNLGAPPIAVDIEDVQGREEIIRAIAVGLYEVDPVTRRVSPFRQITASRLSALLARLLIVRSAACARGVTQDKVLGSCGVNDPLAAHPPDAMVSGATALAALEQIAQKL
ncbi:MAG TPA: tetratricopeptide repeat protein [Thermoanaerobaculia bacterium]|nr:tetratricopeptide repeat protein [Thermoanaerobaculia bacterium]